MTHKSIAEEHETTSKNSVTRVTAIAMLAQLDK